MGYGELRSKMTFYFTLVFQFKNPNNRFEPFNIFFIFKCAWRLNFIFFGIFYYLLSHFENHRSKGPENFTVFYCSSGSAIFKVA